MKLKEIRYRLSACARCKALWGRKCVFCETCWQYLFEIQNSRSDFRQGYYPFATYSLFTWRDEFDHLIRPLIYALKGGIITEPWSGFATDFLFLRSQSELDSNAIIVPAPRKNSRRHGFDHGFHWAHALSSQTGFRVMDCLETDPSGESQKLLNISDRQRRRFVTNASPPGRATVIFADDTVTSGATAMAVFEAFDFPERFEVWTLVSRPRLSMGG